MRCSITESDGNRESRYGQTRFVCDGSMATNRAWSLAASSACVCVCVCVSVCVCVLAHTHTHVNACIRPCAHLSRGTLERTDMAECLYVLRVRLQYFLIHLCTYLG